MREKMAVDVEKTLRGLGISGHEYGDEFLTNCPKHFERTGKEDRNPSFSVNLNSGLFNCFSCGYSGGIHRLVADLKGITVEEAEELVIKPPLTASRLPGAYVKVKDRTLPESILARFVEPPAWALRERRLTMEACEVYGVLWDPMNETWITPIRAPYTNKLMGWQEKGQTHRMFNNYPAAMLEKSKTLFGIDVFKGGRMIVVESPLDAVRLLSAGIEGGVSTMGVRVSKTQLDLMSMSDSVVFALDNPAVDEDGASAIKELYKKSRGLKNVYFFDYSDTMAKDPGDMDADSIRAGLENAIPRAYGLANA